MCPASCRTPDSSSFDTMSAFRSMSKSTRFIISPAPRHRFTTNSTPSRQPRPASTAPSTCWAWPNALKAKILQASTSEVYGDPTVHPQTEDYWGHVNPIGPRSCYRRRQTLRRDVILRLSPTAQSENQDCAHLQHVWATHASQ